MKKDKQILQYIT